MAKHITDKRLASKYVKSSATHQRVNNAIKNRQKGLGSSSVRECSPGMHEVLRSIPGIRQSTSSINIGQTIMVDIFP